MNDLTVWILTGALSATVTALIALLITRGALNSQLSGKALEAACALNDEERAWLAGVLEKLKLSARAYHRVLRVALTLADLQGEPKPSQPHFIEAIGYRQLDRLLKGA